MPVVKLRRWVGLVPVSGRGRRFQSVGEIGRLIKRLGRDCMLGRRRIELVRRFLWRADRGWELSLIHI